MKGFTLVELLVVIGIIVILMTAALIAINPFRQFAMANNASRWSGVTTIMNAVAQRTVDKKGSVTWDCDMDGTDDPIPTSATIMADSTTLPAGYDICGCLVSDVDADFDDYIANMPYDPQTGSYTSCTTYKTGYTIARDATTNRITICAEDTQIPPEATKICITR